MRPSLQRFKKFLKFLSPGQLDLGLYYKGQTTFGSFYGGIFTLCAALFMIGYSINVILPVIQGTGKSVDLSITQLDLAIDQYSIKPISLFSDIKAVFIDASIDSNLTQAECERDSQIYLTFLLKNFTLYQNQDYTEYEQTKMKLECISTFYDDSLQQTFAKFKATFPSYSEMKAWNLNETLLRYEDTTDEIKYSQYQLEIEDLSKSFNFKDIVVRYTYYTVSNGLFYYYWTTYHELDGSTQQLMISTRLMLENVTTSFIGYDTNYRPEFYTASMKFEEIVSKDDKLFFYGSANNVLANKTDKLSRIQIGFQVSNEILFIRVTYETLISAMSKIGGMIAIVKMFSSVIQYINLQLFQKRLKKITADIEPLHDESYDNEKLKKNQIDDHTDDKTSAPSKEKLLNSSEHNHDHAYKEIFSYDQMALIVKEFSKLKNENLNLRYDFEEMKKNMPLKKDQ